MKVVTVAEMRELERLTEEHGVSTEELMQNAGLAFAQEVRRDLGNVGGRRIVVLVGPGNNGGDGLVATRHLHDWGAELAAFLFARRRPGDRHLDALLERGVPTTPVGSEEDLSELRERLANADAVIDALLGTGRARPIEGAMAQALEAVTQRRRRRPPLSLYALDLPSGCNADTGEVDAATVAADMTVTLGYPKVGLFVFPAADYVGRLRTVNIGIPAGLDENLPTELTSQQAVRRLLPQRPRSANKGTFGRVLVCGGSPNYVGAVALACEGALRVGAGLVTAAVAESIQSLLASQLRESTYVPLPEQARGILSPTAADSLAEQMEGYQVLLLGPGLGQHRASRDFVRRLLLRGSAVPPRLLADADGLNILAQTPDWWKALSSETAVLTPHPGEMARLMNTGVAQVQSDRLGTARQAAATFGQTVVLKGAFTIVAAPDGRAHICPTASAALASPGTGDVLAGAIAGLMAQGLAPYDAAVSGVYLHAQAGERLAARLGDAGVLAGDLLYELPQVLHAVKAPG